MFETSAERVARKEKDNKVYMSTSDKQRVVKISFRSKHPLEAMPRDFAFKPATEVHRVQEKLKHFGKYESDPIDWTRIIRQDFFRQPQKQKWLEPLGFANA